MLTELAKKRVAVFIMSHNRLEMTRRSILSVIQNTVMPFTLCAIDWTSTDGTREMVKQLCKDTGHCYVEDNSDMSYAECNAYWMKQFDGEFDYIFLLNNDCEMFPGCLEHGVAAFIKDPTIGHVASWVSRADWHTTMSHGANLDVHSNTVIPFMNNNHAQHPQNLNQEGLYYAYAGFGLYRMDLCKAIDYLEWPPGSRIYWDDTDYGMKVNSAGFKVQYVPQCRIGHVMHIDDNRSRHNETNSLENGRKWFKSRWSNFVQALDGYDPMRTGLRPIRNDREDYHQRQSVKDCKGYRLGI